MSVITEAQQISKLSGNIDSYPCWDNEIHKKLKLKHYAEDVDERLKNIEMTKAANLDFNSRYFPIRSPGIPTLASLVAEKELAEKATKHGLMSKEKIYSYAQSYLAHHPPPSMHELSKEYLNDFLLSIGGQTTQGEALDAINEELKKFIFSSERSPKISQETKQIYRTSLEQLSDNALYDYENTMKFQNIQKTKEAAKEFKTKISLDDYEQIEEKPQAQANVVPFGKKALLPTFGIPFTFTEKKEKKTKKEFLPPAYVMAKKMNPGFVGEKTPKEFREGYLMSKEDIIGSGFKIPKTKNALINRFNILKGEVCAGNDNSKLINELTHITKVLYEKGLLNKHL